MKKKIAHRYFSVLVTGVCLVALLLGACGSSSSPLTQYRGDYIVDGYCEVTPSGGQIRLPAVNREAVPEQADYLSQVLNQLTAEPFNVADGDPFYRVTNNDYVGFLTQNGILPICARGNYEKLVSVYEIYTGKILTPFECMMLARGNRGTADEIKKELLEEAEQVYVERAMEDSRYTRQGLQVTLKKEDWTYNNGIVFYDENGEYIYEYRFSGSDFRADLLYYPWNLHGQVQYKDLCASYAGVDLPAGNALEENMRQSLADFEAKTGADIHEFSVEQWAAGRYLVYCMKMHADDDYAYKFFFLDLVSSQVVEYNGVYATMALDENILNQKIRQAVEQDYQALWESVTNEPFSWNHDQQLYARTLEQANVNDVLVIPGSEQLEICYNAYITSDGVAQQRMCCIPAIDIFGTVSHSELALYPNLAELIDEYYGADQNIGAANYGVWQWGDILVVAVGKYNADMEWIGYNAVCFDTVGGYQEDLSYVLTQVGMNENSFEQIVRGYLTAGVVFQ